MKTAVKSVNRFATSRNPSDRAMDILPFQPLFDNGTESVTSG
jgi:hypothetical protein